MSTKWVFFMNHIVLQFTHLENLLAETTGAEAVGR
jgi:hypothetical protein